MNCIYKIGCRVFQSAFRLALPVLPYREPEIVGNCEKLIPILKKENMHCVLIVTDTGIVRNGLLECVCGELEKANIEYVVYDSVKPNPTVENVENGLQLYYEKQCDGCIAIGGGSSMDCGKGICARAANPSKTISQMKGLLRVFHELPPLIAIPTTAGTGSEVTLAAVISDPKKQDKYALMDFHLIPKYAVLDPKMTVSLPPFLTATTGMDALTHAIEAYIGQSSTKQTRAYAKHAIKSIYENLYCCYKDGTNITARKNMALAAYEAGIAFSKSYVGYIHAIAHSLGGMYDTQHGLANAIVMPYVLKAYGSAIHEKLKELACVVGECDASAPADIAASCMISSIEKLNASMRIPQNLSEIRVEDIPVLAKHAAKEANPLYPVPVLYNAKELEKIYYQIKGR